MVYRRCPQCGASGDDKYGFCIRCGWEFPKIDPSKRVCPLCGYENPEEAEADLPESIEELEEGEAE